MMKLDLHVHTIYSADGSEEPKNYLKLAEKMELSGFAVTDHNEIKGALKTFELSKKYRELTIVRGIEVSSSAGHILGYGISESIPRGLTPEETIERIIDQGGVVVGAHPYRMASGLGEEVVRKVHFTSIEVLNHRSPKHENKRAMELARDISAGITGGSDAHRTKELGLAATEFEFNSGSEGDILEAIAKKRTKSIGESSTFLQGLHMYSKLVVHWLGRGFRRL